MRPHIAIHVKKIAESVEFYKKVFDVEPQKQTASYAKFDLEKPPLNFSLIAGASVSRVSHLGIEVDSAGEVQHWKEKLQHRGILNSVEMKTNCCFARQDKVWFQDPDGNDWEVFYVHEQLPLNDENRADACCV